MDENRLDIPIGERFNWCRLVYEVRVGVSCQDCSFWVNEHHVCEALNYAHFPKCGWNFRKDRKSVVFIQIDEEK